MPEGSLPIAASGIQCAGSEASILDCPADTVVDVSCQRFQDVGISCGGQVLKHKNKQNKINHY